MSTQRFMPRLGNISGRLALAMLVGAFLALQWLCPAFVFASTHGRQSVLAAIDTDQQHIQDKVGISVVRLVATYGAGDQAITCTGLGFLVGSDAMTVNGQNLPIYQDWVLTDGNLVNMKVTGCDQPDNAAPDAKQLSALQILANEAYASSAGVQLDNVICNSLNGPFVCADAEGQDPILTFASGDNDNPSGFTTLFTFHSKSPQPYLTSLLNSSANFPQTPVSYALGLDDQTGQIPVDAKSPNTYLKVHMVLTNGSGATELTPHLESGTPAIDGNGVATGLYLSNGQRLDLKDVPFSSAPSLPHKDVTNNLKTLWDNGIDTYYQGLSLKSQKDPTAPQKFRQADSLFKQVHTANGSLQAAQTFDALALSNISETPVRSSTSVPTTTPRPAKTPTAQSQLDTSSANGVIIGLGVALVLLIVLLVWLTIKMGQVRKRRQAKALEESELARIDQEQDEAWRRAEMEIQRRNQAPPPPPDPAFNLPAPGSVPVNGVSTAIPDQPTIEIGPGVLPAAPTQEITTTRKTTRGRKNAVPDEKTVMDTQQFHGRNLGLTVGWSTDPGIKRKHKPNEDSIFAMQGARTFNDKPQQFGLFVVADGMGGHANGQNASRLAIQTIIDYMVPKVTNGITLDDEGFKKLLGEGVQSANQAVHGRNVEERADMGTTMTAALVIGSVAYVANVGDSRTYLYRASQGLQKVTHDHSVVASLVDAGIIQEDDIYTHPKRNQIYRSLGEKPEVEVDLFQIDLMPGDKLLLCSDGLWDMVRDPKIQDVLSKQTTDPNKTGQDLIKAAHQGGGEDNVTVIVVQMSELRDQPGIAGVTFLAKPDNVTLPTLPSVQ